MKSLLISLLMLPLAAAAHIWEASVALAISDKYSDNGGSVAVSGFNPQYGPETESGQASGFVWKKERTYAVKDVEYVKQFAEEGDLDAIYKMGELYQSGNWGAEHDEEEAFRYYLMAAKHGYVEAFIAVAEYYANGLGGIRDKVMALYYRNKYVDAYSAVGKEVRIFFATDEYWKGLSYEIAGDYDQAIYWYCEGGKKDDAYSLANLGDLFYNGIGVGIDYAEAVFWYEAAGEEGDLYSMSRLVDIYGKGRKGVHADEENVKYWKDKISFRKVFWRLF